jgi:hypothetical protein
MKKKRMSSLFTENQTKTDTNNPKEQNPTPTWQAGKHSWHTTNITPNNP